MRTCNVLVPLALLLAGCGAGGGESDRARVAAPVTTPEPVLETADTAEGQVLNEARFLARALDLDAAAERRVAEAIGRAWADIERDVPRLAAGELPAGDADSLDEAVALLIEARQAALDRELAEGLDPARRARFQALGGRLEPATEEDR